MADVTRLLDAAELLLLVYEELRKLAAARMAEERPGQTLQPPALVYDAYILLVDATRFSAGTRAAISSPPRPRRCGGS